ncbi:unnamed protein product [Enterobius vermicularis]|uniref:NR LBD domain-containing protein n=1 Tax=Enterobius vermicularis TaxID=51028 RepID=A0A0N4V5S4_ENTVE|nr:unnamed protein product [Enterobius vermicularis]
MEPDAIRPDRDVIGKQKNPRRRKLRKEESLLPSPDSVTHCSLQEEGLITFLLDTELQVSSPIKQSKIQGITAITRIKLDLEMQLNAIFKNKSVLDSDRFNMSYEVGRTATVEQLNQATRRYIAAAIDWIDALFSFANLMTVHEKVCVLKSVFAAFCTFSEAARTAQNTTDRDILCLCNGTVIPRQTPRHLVETNFLSNNMLTRLLDELAAPIRKLCLREAEIVALTALIMLDADATGLSCTTSQCLATLRNKVQHALFQMIRDQLPSDQPISSATSRFGNILMILPPLAKVSSLMGENIQFAKMFGSQAIDPLLIEIFIDSPIETIPSTNPKTRVDVSTQTFLPIPNSPLTPPPTVLPCTSVPTTPQLPDATKVSSISSVLGNSATNNSYSFYFPYSARLPSSINYSNQSAGPYPSQTDFFDGNSQTTTSAEIMNNFRFL